MVIHGAQGKFGVIMVVLVLLIHLPPFSCPCTSAWPPVYLHLLL